MKHVGMVVVDQVGLCVYDIYKFGLVIMIGVIPKCVCLIG